MARHSSTANLALAAFRWLACLAFTLGFAGCVAPGSKAFKMQPDGAGARARETRQFAGHTPSVMLAACAGVLQDLDFTVVESEQRMGLIVATKERSGRRKEGVPELVLTLPLQVMMAIIDPVPDDPPERQLIQASVIVNPRSDDGCQVRLTLQRTVYARSRRILILEPLNDPKLLEAFFEALAKSAFLETHHI